MTRQEKMGSSLQGNFVIWREKMKKYIRETLPHWREIYLAGGKFCTACREIKIFFPGLVTNDGEESKLETVKDHLRDQAVSLVSVKMKMHQ